MSTQDLNSLGRNLFSPGLESITSSSSSSSSISSTSTSGLGEEFIQEKFPPANKASTEQTTHRPENKSWGEGIKRALNSPAMNSFKKIAGGLMTLCTLPSAVVFGLAGGAVGGLMGLGSAILESRNPKEAHDPSGFVDQDQKNTDLETAGGKRSFWDKYGEDISLSSQTTAAAGFTAGTFGGLLLLNSAFNSEFKDFNNYDPSYLNQQK